MMGCDSSMYFVTNRLAISSIVCRGAGPIGDWGFWCTFFLEEEKRSYMVLVSSGCTGSLVWMHWFTPGCTDSLVSMHLVATSRHAGCGAAKSSVRIFVVVFMFW